MEAALPMTMAARITPCPPNPAMRISVSCMTFRIRIEYLRLPGSDFVHVAVAERMLHLLAHQVAIVGALAIDELADDDLARLAERDFAGRRAVAGPCSLSL